MNLNRFPSVAACMRIIESDNSGPRARPLNMDALVPANWIEKFDTAERALATLKDKKLKDIIPEDRWGDFELIEDDAFNDCFSVLGAGEFTEQRNLMIHAGFTDEQVGAIDDVLGEFFDGTLTGVFHVLEKEQA